MRLHEVVAWYQKKIGTYDKQQWEKTVEQKILDGFSSVTLKTAKLKTELIDVDLVRGSTFPKAKSKQSLLTVIRLAILRYFLLPVYTKWWVKQTSPKVFGLLLFLYITQMVNWAMYTFHIHQLQQNESRNSTTTTTTTEDNVKENTVSLAELLIPMGLSLLLSLIHSQIVATNSVSGCKSRRRRYLNVNPNGKQQRGSSSEARVVRQRRKKLVKVRSQELVDGTSGQHRKATSSSIKKINSGVEVISKPYKNVSLELSKPVGTTCIINTSSKTKTSKDDTDQSQTRYSATSTCQMETFHSKSTILRNSHTNRAPPLPSQATPLLVPSKPQKLDLDSSLTSAPTTELVSNNHKKRNVNWHSPIHNFAADLEPQFYSATEDKQQQTSPQSLSSTAASSETSSPKICETRNENESTVNASCISGVNSSSSPSGSLAKDIHIEETVKEFYNELVDRTNESRTAAGRAINGARINNLLPRRHVGEDDGFESLNGKSSSGEETASSPLLQTSAEHMGRKQLRLRPYVGEFEEPLSVCCRRKVAISSESEDNKKHSRSPLKSSATADVYQQTIGAKPKVSSLDASSEDTEEEGDDGETISSPTSVDNNSNYNECTTSATEWLGVTTNSEECSYSSELENSDDYKNVQMSDEDGYDLDFTPTTILNPHGTSDRISCTFWDQREFKKAQMSVLEISSCIIERVESMPETKDYIYFGICFSLLLSLIPPFCRLCEATIDADKSSEINFLDVPFLLWEKTSYSIATILNLAFGKTQWERTILLIGLMQRFCLTIILFIIFAVAERTFKQRFLYAKLFSHLTSSRRARKSNLPHFRLNKVRNIKTWLSVRSYLKKRGPQRSVDVIVSAAFIVTLLLLAFLSVEWLKDSVHLHSHLNLEALLWSTTIGIFLLRFMTLGNKIHHKYRSVSVLITEQINLYLQIEQKPKKKEELMVSNSVLKLAADLLKELETPFKISGLSANPYLFTTIKVVILSALSGVLSEMLGFKLKLHKIKIK